jgi:hypothetical protein
MVIVVTVAVAVLIIIIIIGVTPWRNGLRYYTTSRKVAGSIPVEVFGYFNWPNSSSRTIGLGSTQPLTEMSIRNLPGDKGRPAPKADNLPAICEPII